MSSNSALVGDGDAIRGRSGQGLLIFALLQQFILAIISSQFLLPRTHHSLATRGPVRASKIVDMGIQYIGLGISNENCFLPPRDLQEAIFLIFLLISCLLECYSTCFYFIFQILRPRYTTQLSLWIRQLR